MWHKARSSVPHKNRQTALCQNGHVDRTKVSGDILGCCINQSSVPQKTGITIPRIRHKPNNAKSAAFCNFCVFAGKNDVYLVNQSCKDGKTKALCHIFPHKTLKTLHFRTKKRLHLPVQPHFYQTKLLSVNLL